MKNITAISCMLIVIFSTDVSPKTDTLFVENIINLQVMETRQKKHDELLGNKIENKLHAEAKSTTCSNKEKEAAESSSSLTTKITILASASAGLFLFVFVRRKKLTGSDDTKKLKENIKMIRQEKVFRLNDTKMKKTRILIANEGLHFNNNNVSQVARKFHISKGELQLAARLMQKAPNTINNKFFA